VVKRADATQTVTAADAAMRKAFEARDGAAAAAFFADAGATDGTARFSEAVRTSLETLKADPNGKVQFRPAGESVASEAGDIAYTLGQMDWTASSTPQHEYPITRSANYLYIWRLQTDGTWKVVQAISQEIPYESPYREYENRTSPSPPPNPMSPM
jgi:ketosteroid isomerase-like protein